MRFHPCSHPVGLHSLRMPFPLDGQYFSAGGPVKWSAVGATNGKIYVLGSHFRCHHVFLRMLEWDDLWMKGRCLASKSADESFGRRALRLSIEIRSRRHRQLTPSRVTICGMRRRSMTVLLNGEEQCAATNNSSLPACALPALLHFYTRTYAVICRATLNKYPIRVG